MIAIAVPLLASGYAGYALRGIASSCLADDSAAPPRVESGKLTPVKQMASAGDFDLVPDWAVKPVFKTFKREKDRRNSVVNAC